MLFRFGNFGLAVAETVRHEMQAVDSQVPIAGLRSMDQYLSASIAPRRFNLMVLGVFAVGALMLAAVGVYALLAYSVSRRFQEIRIRMALGAQRRDILLLVIGQGLRPVLAGIALGLGAAVIVARTLSGMLFGMSATDPATFTLVAVGLASVALMACLAPAMRATRGVVVDQISR